MGVPNPFFSYLLPAFNAQNTLARALDSVLAQACDDWELIAIDDGSTDNTLAILEEYAKRDERISVITQTNSGCAAARAHAQELSTGQFLVKFDADDMLDTLWSTEMKAAIAAHPECDFFSCNATLTTYDEHGVVVSSRPYVASPRFKGETSLNLADIMVEPFILGGGSAVARELIETSGGYQRGPRAEDFDFWIRAFLAGAHHYYIPQELYSYTKGIGGQLNDDQRISYASFVESIDSALARTDLTYKQRELLEKGRERYLERTELAYYEHAYVNEELAQQSERFFALLNKIFPRNVARVLYSCAHAIKKPIDPIRIALARKKEEKK